MCHSGAQAQRPRALGKQLWVSLATSAPAAVLYSGARALPQIDLPYAVSEDHLRQSLGLAGYTTGKGKPSLDPNIRPIEVYMCSVAKRMGYGEGFRWLSQYIK